jgi:hypothetical protein
LFLQIPNPTTFLILILIPTTPSKYHTTYHKNKNINKKSKQEQQEKKELHKSQTKKDK